MRALLAIASVSFLVGCAEQAQTQAPIFEPAPSSPLVVGPGSGTVILADLNRDGHVDLVTQHLLAQSINVMLGDGKGGFVTAAGSPMKLSYGPGTITLGDVNNDRVPDLAVAHRDSSSGEYVSVFLGDGRGAFKPALGPRLRVSAAMPFYKPILRLVDLNKDRNVDIVTANGRRPTIEVLLGKGDGAFAAPMVLSLGSARGLSSFAIDDVDGDGHLDIVAANSEAADLSNLMPSRLVVLRGNGRGNFASPSAARSAPAGTVIETLADVNGDGRLDAVITHSGRNILGVLLNQEGQTFASAPTMPIQLPGQSFRVVATDVNGDGKGDLIAATVQSRAAPYDSQVAVFLGSTSGFVKAAGSPFPSGRGAFNLAVADINKDGRPDVVSSSFEGNAVSILLGSTKAVSRQ